MADCKKREKTTVETRYLLDLSEDEALALLAVVNRVGGMPDVSRRRHTNAVGVALADAGVRYTYGEASDLRGSVSFDDDGKDNVG